MGGVVVMTLQVPSWLLWMFAVPVGVLVFWFVFLGICFWWAFLRRDR